MTGSGALRDLHAKYTEIAALRRSTLTRAAARPRMAALAARFPGALRELDALPEEAIDARLGALAGALVGASAEVALAPWMAAQARYHALARGALSVKRWLGRARHVDDEDRRRFREAAEGHAEPSEWLAWAEHLSELAAPPRGRLVPLVVARVAAQLGVSPDEAHGLIFPPRG